MADIVISHTTEDRDRAEVLARSLSAQGLKVWMYRDILGQGGDRDEVTAKVRNATRVIALWSPAGCASPWVLEEAKAAARDHRLINVELGQGMTPKAFQSGLRIDLSNWGGQRSDPALVPFAEAIATIVTGRSNAEAPEKPDKKSMFDFLGAAKQESRARGVGFKGHSMFAAPVESAADVEAVEAMRPDQAKAAPKAAAPKLVVVPPSATAPAPLAEPAPATAAAAEEGPEIQVFETTKPRTMDLEFERRGRLKPSDDAPAHMSLGRAFAYGLAASVMIGILYFAGRHYFNAQPMTVAATALEQRAEPKAAPVELGFRADSGLVKFASELGAQSAALSSVTFGSNEWLFAIGSMDGAARTYVAATGKQFNTYHTETKGVTDVGFDSAADYLAASSVDGSVYVWRLENGSEQRINLGDSPIRVLAWRPDTLYIATGSDAGMLDIRKLTGSGEPIQHKFRNPITSIAWRQDGAVAAVGLKSGGVAFIDPQSGNVVFTAKGHTGAVNALAFSPDGALLGSVGDDGVIKLWNAYDGAAAGEMTAKPCAPEQLSKDGKCPLLAIMFSHDASMVAASGQNQQVDAFYVKSQKPAFALLGHKAPVPGIDWSYNDHRMVSVDSGGKAAFWNSPADSR